jgi:hypothetical protein
MYLSWCLEGFAGIAATRGQHRLAAELDGAREALRIRVGMLLPPYHQAGYARTLATIRDALSEATFEAARAAGENRPLDQTIAAALDAG